MSKKIGFRSYQNDEEPDKRDELEKQQAERQKAIANFIDQNYSHRYHFTEILQDHR